MLVSFYTANWFSYQYTYINSSSDSSSCLHMRKQRTIEMWSPLLGTSGTIVRRTSRLPHYASTSHLVTLSFADVVVVVQSISHIRLFCNPTDYTPPGSCVHGISQARILEWVAISFSSWARNRAWVSCLAGWSFTTEPPGVIVTLFLTLLVLEHARGCS